MSIGVVIPAAGQGKRMKTKKNKQYLELLDRPVLAHTLEVFVHCPQIDQVVVVVHPHEIDYCKKNVINKYFEEDIKIVAGGKTRRESVYAGLTSFSPVIDYVIVHDGARPLVTDNLLNKVIKEVQVDDAVTPGITLKDTVKEVNQQNFVAKTLDRRSLMAVQTPQAFLYKDIVDAHNKVPEDYNVTDDASLIELMGKKVKIVEGSYHNIKITTPIDLVIAEYLLKQR
ncbi:MAG: 2-C-methyl-D-erythritol 4-phosphate cytidylyltransferase [Bacillota bacterium]